MLTIPKACEQLKLGNIIAVPTEAVYGLSCDPRNDLAIKNLLTLKHRPVEKGLILVAAHWEQVADFVALDKNKLNKILLTWPAHTTYLFPATKLLSYYIHGGTEKVAIRLTAMPNLKNLCEVYNSAIVSTSANPAGTEPARSSLEVAHYFPTIKILAGELGGNNNPSTIIDAETGAVLR